MVNLQIDNITSPWTLDVLPFWGYAYKYVRRTQKGRTSRVQVRPLVCVLFKGGKDPEEAEALDHQAKLG